MRPQTNILLLALGDHQTNISWGWVASLSRLLHCLEFLCDKTTVSSTTANCKELGEGGTILALLWHGQNNNSNNTTTTQPEPSTRQPAESTHQQTRQSAPIEDLLEPSFESQRS